MKHDRRYLKRISGFTALQTAARQGWRAAEDMRGQNHYPVGSKRHAAWQEAYHETCLQIADDFNEMFHARDDFDY